MEANRSRNHDCPQGSLNRRDFLKLAGAGVFVLFTAGPGLYFDETLAAPLPDDFNAFLKVGEDGRISCYTGKIEMGQGVVTSLAQMLADELGVKLENVDMVMGDTELCPWDMGTFGSMTTRFFGPALRRAGAEARAVLKELASEKLEVPAAKLAVENGEVLEKSRPGNRVAFSELTRGKRIERRLEGRVEVKDPSEFKIMNEPALRRDSLEKVTGKAEYAGDVRVPGMLYASVLRPPSHDAELISVDASGVEQVEGAGFVRDGELMAVLHEKPDMAAKALLKVKTTYDVPESDLNEDTIFKHLLNAAPRSRVLKEQGDLQKGEARAESVIEYEYLDGYVAHAPMEPHTALVKIDGDKATVWPSSQTPFRAQEEVAGALGLPAENVRVISPYLGGGFGGKTRNLQVVEAARLAKIAGKPVQVAWSRQEEFFHDTFRPAAVVKLRSGVDGKGRISFWDYHVYFAGERGAEHFYEITDHRTLFSGNGWRRTPGSHPFPTGAWRAPANNTNTFARESQIDAMAAKAGADPVEFRLAHLKDKRMIEVLKAARDKFGWGGLLAEGSGKGVACGIDAGTYVAAMAEVEVDRETGETRVKRVVCAQDMGLCVNPQGAAIQMEGCINMGLGYALSEELRFVGGRVLDENFDTYSLPRFSWMPKIETVILDKPDSDPQGGGEPAIVVMGGVIANAIYDACGARLTRLPMTPERVRAAMA